LLEAKIPSGKGQMQLSHKTKAAEKGAKPTSLYDLNNQQELEGFAPLSAAISNQKATAS
jgi:hypothetical protein